jgi:hypothetical protein
MSASFDLRAVHERLRVHVATGMEYASVAP